MNIILVNMAAYNPRAARDYKIHKLYQHKHLNAGIRVNDATPYMDAESQTYEVAEFTSLRDHLNDTKSKMDKFYIGAKSDDSLSKKWNSLQYTVDIYRPMRKVLHERFNAQLVTNAWMKYYEIYSHYVLVPENTPNVLAFFNAELPGAALCALNHYIRTMRPHVQFDWRASSLAPDEATASNTASLGDSYGLYELNREKWMMQLKGEVPDEKRNNGDATIPANLRDWAVKVGPESALGGVDIYSHDAGIDVSEGATGELTFNRQELMNAKIYLGCALAGFMTLKKGGAFIAKQYTFFETFTWNLILIYASLFEDFHICKPLTSRPYNSEIYLVGKGFKGLPEKIAGVLMGRLEHFNTDPLITVDDFRALLAQPFADLQRFSRIAFTQQIQFIEENLQLFDRWGNNIRALTRGVEHVKNERRDFWLRSYPMCSIDRGNWIQQREQREQEDAPGEANLPKNEIVRQDNDSRQTSYEGLV